MTTDNSYSLLAGKRGKWLLPAGGILLFLALVYTIRVALYPFLIAFIIAYLLDPLIDQLEKRGLNRTVAVVLLLVILALFFGALVILVGPLAISQIEELARAAPTYLERLMGKIKPLIESLPHIDQAKLETTLKESALALGTLALKVAKGTLASVWAGLTSVMGLLMALFNAIIIPVAAFYLLKDFDQIMEKTERLIPPRYRSETGRWARKIDTVLSSFVRGQLTVALIMALLLATGLFLTGAPLGLVIGVVAGLANVVPYLAVVVGLAPELLLTWLKFGDWLHPLMVLGVFGFVQALEGFVISPKIMEESVGLHPVAIMAALLIGGEFFGFIGVLLAVPGAAVIKVALDELHGHYRASELYGEEPEPPSSMEEEPADDGKAPPLPDDEPEAPLKSEEK